jgi:NPCBM/NEW2 domain-containing protein
MDSKAHKYIAKKAVEWLPPKAKKFWSQELELLELSSKYLDIFAAPKFVTKEKAAIEPDWYELVHVTSSDREYLLHTSLDPSRIRNTYPLLIEPYLARIISAMEQSDLKKATKLAGCFSHFIGDTGQPAHVVSDETIFELFPLLDKERFMIYHSAVESILGEALLDYSPVLFGTTLPEINWRIIENFEQLRKISRAQEIPILIAIYNNDLPAAQEPANKTVQACVEFFSDLLYTLYCYHMREFQTEDLEQLAQLDLTSLVPVGKYCDMMYGFNPLIDRHPDFSHKDGLTYPAVPFELGTGRTIGGIALFANMAPGYEEVRESYVEYSMPAGIYSSFEAIVGLNHLCQNDAEAIFEVWLDDSCVYTSKILNDKMQGEKISIPLKEATKISLRVRDARPAPCSTKFFYPIWGSTVLIRKRILKDGSLE